MAEINLNCKGLQCPGPIMEVFKAAKGATSGDVLNVQVTERGFAKDIKAWCKKMGHNLESLDEGDIIKAKIVIK